MQELRDRTAVITGAASGIGRALAARAAREGMRLVLADVDAARLEATARELGVAADRVATRVVDVSRDDEVRRLADLAWERFGAVHLLCNNAGVGLGRVTWEHTLADWEWILGVDLWSVIHGVRHFLPRMMAQDADSRIVNTASVAGLLSTPGMAAYNVAKHGVVALSETLHKELAEARSRVGVSVLCPFFVPTGIADSERVRPAHLAGTAPGAASAAYADKVAAAVASGPMTAADMADAVFAALAERRFYVIPFRRINGAIRVRFEDILEQRDPTNVF